MSQVLELPDSLYVALKKAAEANGTTPEGWIAAQLPSAKDDKVTASARTLAELFAGRIGRIHSGGKEALSENCGQKFTDYLRRKHEEGHL